MKKGIYAELPQAGANCKYEINAKGITVTTHLSINSALGQVIGCSVCKLNDDQTIIQLKNQWFIKSVHLFTWAEIEKVGVYNMYNTLMDSARQSRRALQEYHKDAILNILWEKIQK